MYIDTGVGVGVGVSRRILLTSSQSSGSRDLSMKKVHQLIGAVMEFCRIHNGAPRERLSFLGQSGNDSEVR